MILKLRVMFFGMSPWGDYFEPVCLTARMKDYAILMRKIAPNF